MTETKKRAARNRTLTLSDSEVEYYRSLCLSPSRNVSASEIMNKTLLGDTFDLLSKLPSNSIDLLIVDPPYNLSKDFHGQKFEAGSNQEYERFTRAWIEAAIPLLKQDASIYVCCDWRSSLIIGPVLQNYFDIKNRITWQREKGRGAKSNWKNGMEDIWFATASKKDYVFNLDDVMIRRRVIAPYKQNGKPKDWEQTDNGNYRNTCPSNFWDDCTVPYWSMPENTDHPTQKPEKLIAKIILASSKPGDVILDPFLGSGTTSVVAKKLGRNFIGIEQNPLYCAWAEKRLELAETDREIQGYSDGVFWERNSLAAQKSAKHKKEISQAKQAPITKTEKSF